MTPRDEYEWDDGGHPHELLLMPQPALAPGFLACGLLFLFYELGLAWQGPEGSRNLAEMMLGSPLRIFGDADRYVRWALLLAATTMAYVRFRRTQENLRGTLVRSAGEGLLAGMLLGPFLMVLLGNFDAWPGELEVASSPGAPPLAVSLRLFGAAAWEELVFRLGCHSLLFLILARLVSFFGVSRPIALVIGDIGGLLGSSVVFALAHMENVQEWMGLEQSGPPPAFLWRLVAGLVLAGLYRWRGLGVAAWAHGLFNLGMTLGAGPGVFR